MVATDYHLINSFGEITDFSPPRRGNKGRGGNISCMYVPACPEAFEVHRVNFTDRETEPQKEQATFIQGHKAE